MDKVQRFINNAHKLYYPHELPKNITHIPKYVIRTYIRSNPHKYFEIGCIYQYYYHNYDRMHEYYQKTRDDAYKLLHLGLYYKYMDNDKMKEYMKKAVKLGNADAMTYLASYEYINRDLMKKYYLDAIALGNSNAMFRLGNYYQFIENNYDLMKKYYLDAIALGNTDAMNFLGNYYKQDYELMKHYYMRAIKLNDICTMVNILDYYKN